MRAPDIKSSCIALAVAAATMSPARAETPLERGTYLMRSIVACGNCHTPKGPQGELPGMELAGNFKIQDDAFTAVVPNITPDPETGIGKWSEEEIAEYLGSGNKPDGDVAGGLMAEVIEGTLAGYKDLTQADRLAIARYLKTVPPVRNKVEIKK